MLLTWEHFHRVNSASGQIKSDTYLRIWADFFWNFRLNEHDPAGMPRLIAQNVRPASLSAYLAPVLGSGNDVWLNTYRHPFGVRA